MIPREFYKFVDAQMRRKKQERDFEFNKHAALCATIANFSLAKPKNKKYKVKDFLPADDNEMTEEQMLKQAAHIVRAFGGEDLRDKKEVIK